MIGTMIATIAVVTVSTHLSCWRSSPCARRSRSTSARAPRASATQVTIQHAKLSAFIASRSPATPSGLLTRWNGSSYGPGRSAAATRNPTIATANAAATGRQRRDGSLPSGNSSSARPISGAVTCPHPSTAAVRPGTSPSLA